MKFLPIMCVRLKIATTYASRHRDESDTCDHSGLSTLSIGCQYPSVPEHAWTENSRRRSEGHSYPLGEIRPYNERCNSELRLLVRLGERIQNGVDGPNYPLSAFVAT